MWFEILLVVLLEACLLNAYDSEEEESYHNVKIQDEAILDPLEESRRQKRSDGNATMDPKDIELIKGGIQELINEVDPDYIGPTNPTRTPAGNTTTITKNTTKIINTDLTNVTETTLVALVTQLLDNLTLTSPRPTRSSYIKLLEQLMDYADVEVTRKPLRTSTGQIRPPPTGARPALRQRPARRRTRRRSTAPPSRRTRNRLCTHSREICATMCFDEEKYRVSCTTSERTTQIPRLDISKVVGMLSEIVEDYDTNITQQLYNALLKKGYKPCERIRTTPILTTYTTETVEPVLYDYEESNKTGAVISKCFVCGLEEEGIPGNAHCSDAFAGEFIPMTPVDAAARGKLASFRKYCKFMDMIPWYINGTDGRSMWGRWSGGCAVRWVDLSGVYTQRTCRNRARPVLGHHFVSKRMARLERALKKVDNGCIISPMASLVPFSRGVSLYARFHACVCTGSWCNGTTRPGYKLWMLFLLAVAHVFNS